MSAHSRNEQKSLVRNLGLIFPYTDGSSQKKTMFSHLSHSVHYAKHSKCVSLDVFSREQGLKDMKLTLHININVSEGVINYKPTKHKSMRSGVVSYILISWLEKKTWHVVTDH